MKSSLFSHRSGPLLLLALSLSATFIAGCGGPTWIHRLPPADTPRERGLDGVWVRLSPSRYTVADPSSYSYGKETLQIEGERYTKLHRYREVVHTKELVRVYREKGEVRRGEFWILFVPHTAESYEKKRKGELLQRKVGEHSFGAPSVEESLFRRRSTPRPLLFYYEPERERLTPLVYEWMGKEYRFGLRQGVTKPYDHTSPSFRFFLRRYNDKKFRPHGYVKSSWLPSPLPGESSP